MAGGATNPATPVRSGLRRLRSKYGVDYIFYLM
jgi:hypothetical protein